MAIEKSLGQTRTEQYLSQLCDRTFLQPWSYANPYKDDGKELCDLIVVFEKNVFLFFDRESRKFDHGGDVLLTWERWKREAITKQIRTAAGAKRYVLTSRDRIFLDVNGTIPLPVSIPAGDLSIHKIIVAHGAKEACERHSASNVYGSLGVTYETAPSSDSLPFIVPLDRTDPVHLLDSHNLELGREPISLPGGRLVRSAMPRQPIYCCTTAQRRYVPEPDSCTIAKGSLFSHLVGAGEPRRWHRRRAPWHHPEIDE